MYLGASEVAQWWKALADFYAEDLSSVPSLWHFLFLIIFYFLNFFLWIYMYECFSFMYVWVPHVHLVPKGVRREQWISQTRSYRQLRAATWELGTDPLGEQPVLTTTEPSLQPPTLLKLVMSPQWGLCRPCFRSSNVGNSGCKWQQRKESRAHHGQETIPLAVALVAMVSSAEPHA